MRIFDVFAISKISSSCTFLAFECIGIDTDFEVGIPLVEDACCYLYSPCSVRVLTVHAP